MTLTTTDVGVIRDLRRAFDVWSYTLNRDPAAPDWHTWHGPIRTDAGIARQPWMQYHDGRIVYNDGRGVVLAATVTGVTQVLTLLAVLNLIPQAAPVPAGPDALGWMLG